MQGQLEGLEEALYFTDGEPEAYRGGRDSLRSTQQVEARPELEPTYAEVFSMCGSLAGPVPSLSQNQTQLGTGMGMGPGEGRVQVSHWQELEGVEVGGERASLDS